MLKKYLTKFNIIMIKPLNKRYGIEGTYLNIKLHVTGP